jgi:hypothetical protein
MTAEAVVSTASVSGDRLVEIPSVLRCGLTMSFVKLMLRILGFAGTLAWICHEVAHVLDSASVDVEMVKRAEHAVALAGALYPGRALCLEQSLTLYYLLRRQGVAVKYCQGVQPYPFEAHAWIEYRGEVITDVPEHVSHFARLPDQLP